MIRIQMNIVLPKIKLIDDIKAKVYPSTDFVLYFDGCSKGNPGEAGIGAVIYKNGVEYWSNCKYIGNNKTNNEAEYSALILGLEGAITHKIKKLSVCGDSLLVINQINKIYKVKHPNLYELYEQVNLLKTEFSYIEFNHVYRKDNKRADQLSNIALELNNNNNKSKISIIENIKNSDSIEEDGIEEDINDWEEELVIDKILQKPKKKHIY